MKKLLQLWVGAVLFCTACNSKQKEIYTDDLKKEAVDTLRSVLHEQQEWVKVHAAEFLILTGNDEGVKDVFLQELSQFNDKLQYRIGIWRVLARLSSGLESEQYQNKIVRAFLDTAGKDRVHAIETMAKLKISPLPEYPLITENTLHSEIKNLSLYTHWAVSYTNIDSAVSAKKYFLERLLDENEEVLQQRIAAYVLRYLDTIDKEDWDLLNKRLQVFPDDSGQKAAFLNTALITAPVEIAGGEDYKRIFEQLLNLNSKKDKGTRLEIAAALSVIGNREHLPFLLNWLHQTDPLDIPSEEADVQAFAAYAILNIIDREKKIIN